MIGSPNGYHQKLSHKIPYKATQTPTIWNRYIRGFSPFDWLFILSNASEIHTPDTSLVYVVEILRNMNLLPEATKLFMYQREG